MQNSRHVLCMITSPGSELFDTLKFIFLKEISEENSNLIKILNLQTTKKHAKLPSIAIAKSYLICFMDGFRLKRTSPTAYCDCWEKCKCKALIAGQQGARQDLLNKLLEETDLVTLNNSRSVFNPLMTDQSYMFDSFQDYS